jgi:hypothetical protein
LLELGHFLAKAQRNLVKVASSTIAAIIVVVIIASSAKGRAKTIIYARNFRAD